MLAAMSPDHMATPKRWLPDVPDRDTRVTVKELSSTFPRRDARYVKVRAYKYGAVPPWHPGAGGQAWIFVDEIIVE